MSYSFPPNVYHWRHFLNRTPKDIGTIRIWRKYVLRLLVPRSRCQKPEFFLSQQHIGQDSGFSSKIGIVRQFACPGFPLASKTVRVTQNKITEHLSRLREVQRAIQCLSYIWPFTSNHFDSLHLFKHTIHSRKLPSFVFTFRKPQEYIIAKLLYYCSSEFFSMFIYLCTKPNTNAEHPFTDKINSPSSLMRSTIH